MSNRNVINLQTNNYSHAVKIKHRQLNRSNRNWIMSTSESKREISKGELWDYCHFGESFSHWIFYFQTCTADPSRLPTQLRNAHCRQRSLTHSVTVSLGTIQSHHEPRQVQWPDIQRHDWMAIHSRNHQPSHIVVCLWTFVICFSKLSPSLANFSLLLYNEVPCMPLADRIIHSPCAHERITWLDVGGQ